MRMFVAWAALAVSSACVSVPPSGQARQADLDRLASGLGYRFTVIDNKPADCPGGGGCFLSEIELAVPSDLSPALSDEVEIRFGQVSRIISADSELFDVRLINGDLHALKLKPGKALAPGETYKVRLTGGGHFFSTAYPMPNAHLMAPGLEGRTIAASRPVTDPETGLELLPFVAPMNDEAKLATSDPADRTQWLTPERAFERYAARGAAATPDIVIVPKPVEARRLPGNALDLTKGIRLVTVGAGRGDIAAALRPLADGGIAEREGGVPVRIAVGPGQGSGSYALQVTPQEVRIAASDAPSASHALRSLAQQALHEGGRVRPFVVADAPRYPFRGLHVDVARNFHSKEELLKLIEQMAAYKLNKLHLHMGDDEGWRLEIKQLPELARIGGYRCYDDSETRCLLPQLGADPDPEAPTNGYLSQADYLDLLYAAKARHIEVIPSFDMPGHSRAAIKAMEARYRRLMAEGKSEEAELYRLVEPGDITAYRSIQNYDDNTLNVCIDSTYRFLDTMLDEVAALHAQAGTPLATYHIGADETAGAWSESPACKAMMAKTGLTPAQLGAHFIERVSAGLAGRGVTAAGWSDGMGHTDPARMPASVQSNIWGGLFNGGVTEAHAQANRGWDIVLSIPDYAYLDMPYAPDPNERGYDWAAREVEMFKIFSLMPGNLPANAAVATDILARPGRIEDKVPMEEGRRISGIQAQLWSETIRSDAQVDYMFFPRLLALAERAWAPAAWEPAYKPGEAYVHGDARVDQAALLAGWRDFAGRAGAQLSVLDKAGIAYRLPPPGARIRDGMLEANAELPSLGIEYREGEGPWRPYAGPVRVQNEVWVRSLSPGKRPGRAVRVSAD